MKKRIFLSPPDMTGKELDLIHEVFDSNFIAPVGPMLKRFEDDFCRYTGFKHACAVVSGTAAIHLGLAVLGIKPKDYVISSTLTFIGGVFPILYQGATPAFIDCGFNYTTSAYALEDAFQRLEFLNKLPSAVILTDLYGQCCDMKELMEICTNHGIPVVVDACESLGSIAYGKHAGKGADIAAFSFNGNKIITSSGGGMIASDDKDLIDMARHMSQQSVDPGYDFYNHSMIGYNYRMSNVVAAIGVGQLEALDEKVEKKRKIFQYYYDRLKKFDELQFMKEYAYGTSSRWQCVVSLRETSPVILKNALEEENIESRFVFRPMHMQPVFMNNPEALFFGDSYSNAKFLSERGLCLPCGTAMTEEDLDRVCKVIEGVLK